MNMEALHLKTSLINMAHNWFETKLTFNSGVFIIINSELKTNEDERLK